MTEENFMYSTDDYETRTNGSWNCTFFYTTSQKLQIMLAAGTIGGTSLVFCVVALSLVLLYGLHKKSVYRLASYQVIGSMLISAIMILATVPILEDKVVFYYICQITGVLLEYFLWVKLLIALCLIFHIFCIGVLRKNFKNLEICYIVFSLCFPMLFAWIPFTTNSFGLTQSWCWIKDAYCNGDPNWEGVAEQYSLWFGPLAICTVISFIAIIVIIVSFKYRYNKVIEVSTERDPLLEDSVKQYMLNVYFRKLMLLLIYPVVFFILFIFPTIRMLKNNGPLSSPANFKLSLAHTSIYCSFGFFSGILLILHVLLVRRMKSWSSHFFPANSEIMKDNSSMLPESSYNWNGCTNDK